MTARALSSRTTVVAVLVLVGLLVWAVGWTSLLSVREVVVEGPPSVSAADVRRAAGDLGGVPLARVDLGAIEARVEQLPAVAGATVTRSWPATVRVVVVARVPVVAIKSTDGVALVDSSGAVARTVASPPPGLPLLRTGGSAAADQEARTPQALAAISVVATLPADLRTKVVAAGAVGPEDVRLTLLGGAVVRWGGTGEGSLKSSVLRALLKQPAKVYDVSAPLLPTTRS